MIADNVAQKAAAAKRREKAPAYDKSPSKGKGTNKTK